MIIINENPFSLDSAPGSALSCLMENDEILQGFEQYNSRLFQWDKSGRMSQIPLTQKFEKLAYCAKRQQYFATSRHNMNAIYVLDQCFCELDCIKIKTEYPCIPIEDIWFDSQSDLLWLVFPQGIYRFNCGGDCLGGFITAPPDTKYTAVCSCGEMFFIAYRKAGCSYVASYTRAGAQTERISLGGDYTVRNLQIVTTDNGPCLKIFALKKMLYPFVIEIALEHHHCDPVLTVECFNDTPLLRSTCHIDSGHP